MSGQRTEVSAPGPTSDEPMIVLTYISKVGNKRTAIITCHQESALFF